MRVLALDTTTADGSVAIVNDEGVLLERLGDRTRSHTERLPNDIMTALAAVDLTLRDVDLFAIVAGPGSFTGLRTGIATMQGLALVGGKQMVALSAIDVLCTAASIDAPPGVIVGAWMDAHRRQVFAALYRVGEGNPFDPESLTEVEAATVGEPLTTLARWQANHVVPSVLAGDGATLYGDLAAGVTRVIPHPLLAPIAGRMAIARAARGLAVPPTLVLPIYVRRPDVEVTRDARRAADSAARAVASTQAPET